MTLETLSLVGAAVAAIVSTIFGGGMLNKYIKHSGDLAVADYRLKENEAAIKNLIKEVADLKNDSIEVNTKLQQYADHIRKLDLLPTLVAKLEAMESLVGSVQELVSLLTKSSLEKHSR